MPNDPNRDRLIAYFKVFESDEGKKVLADLEDVCHAFVASHIPGDSHETAFRDGERNVYLHIRSQIAAAHRLAEESDRIVD